MLEFGIGHNGAPETPANTIHAFCQVVASQDWFGGLVPSPIDASRPSYAMTEGAIYIIGQAYIGGGSIIVRGRLMKLTNGQVADSIRVLADVFNWSPRQVRRLLSKLSEAGFIEFTDEPENGQRSKSLIVCFERITSELINQLRTSDRTGHVSLVREPASGPQSEPVNEPAKYELTNGKTYTNDVLHQQQRTSERTGSRTSAEPEALCSNTHAHARISKPINLSGLSINQKGKTNVLPKKDSQGSLEIGIDTAGADQDTDRKPKRVKPDIGRAEALAAYERYNSVALTACWQQAAKLTPSRERGIIARLKEFGVESWDKALADLAAWKWGRGENPSGWRVSLDYVYRGSVYQKAVEGGYSAPAGAVAAKINGHPYTPPPRAESEDEYLRRNQERFARLAAEG